MSSTPFGNHRFDFARPLSQAEPIARIDALANLMTLLRSCLAQERR